MVSLETKIRTVIFFIVWAICSVIYCSLIILALLLPYKYRHRFACGWASLSIYLAKIICKLNWQVSGAENLPQGDKAGILAVNHQSTWETLFMPHILPKQIWVLKRELLFVPFFGWAMATLRPIAINRKSGRKAMAQVAILGKKKINSGYSLVIFPEGHRYPYDYPLKFKSGASYLANVMKMPVIPIAHNAGMFWARGGWIKSGTIKIRIGKEISSAGKSIDELNTELENWVRKNRDEIVKEQLAYGVSR